MSLPSAPPAKQLFPLRSPRNSFVAKDFTRTPFLFIDLAGIPIPTFVSAPTSKSPDSNADRPPCAVSSSLTSTPRDQRRATARRHTTPVHGPARRLRVHPAFDHARSRRTDQRHARPNPRPAYHSSPADRREERKKRPLRRRPASEQPMVREVPDYARQYLIEPRIRPPNRTPNSAPQSNPASRAPSPAKPQKP